MPALPGVPVQEAAEQEAGGLACFRSAEVAKALRSRRCSVVTNLAARDVVVVAVAVGTRGARGRGAVIANHRYGSDDRIVAGARPVHGMMDDRIVARPRPVQRRVACHRGVMVVVMVVFAVPLPVAVTAIDAAAVPAVAAMFEMSATAMTATAMTAPALAAPATMGESSAGASSNQQDERTAGNEMQACPCDRANPHDALPVLFGAGESVASTASHRNFNI